MTKTTRIILHGCMGKLATAISTLAQTDNHCEIVAGVDIAVSSDSTLYPTYTDLSHFDGEADVVVDCSIAEAVPSMLKFAQNRKIPLVICTTGLSQQLTEEVQKTSKKVAVLQSANMSLGINLLVNMAGRAAKLLSDAKFDIEIIEKHHNQKIDAPSGTAIALAKAINQALDNKMEYVYDRSQLRQKRAANEIGMHAMRGGTIVGEHSVIFAGCDELIEFKHQALSKEVFAVGALKAASFMNGREIGFYTMQDVIDAV